MKMITRQKLDTKFLTSIGHDKWNMFEIIV